MRHACAAFVVVLLGLPGAGFADAPAAAPLAEQHLNVDGLNAWGTRAYSMTYCKPDGDPSSEQFVGRMTLTCESKEGLVKFVNVTRMYLPDGVRFIEYRGESVHARAHLLSTKEVRLNAGRSDGVTLQEVKATMDGGKVTIVTKKDGGSSTLEGKWLDGTAVDVALFFLVTLLPREANQHFPIENFAESSDLRQATPRILECVGPDQQVGVSEKPCTLFLLYKPNDRAKAVRYWVSQDGLLRRVQLNPQNRLDLIVEEQDKGNTTK